MSAISRHVLVACRLVLGPLCWGFDASAADTVLPQGEVRKALECPHFPDRLHAFIWRNWNLVEPAKLAGIVGASDLDITTVADSMGLPPPVTIPPEIRERGYATLIRRNWHLLPYDQLLELLEMTPERLAFTLREEDFLWIKLGRLKPACGPLRYTPPGEAERRRAAEIRRVVEQDFGDELRRPAEPRFDFVRQLGHPLPSFVPPRAGEPGSPGLRLSASHGAWDSCRRCRERTDTDIIAEVIGAIEEGVHRGNPAAEVVVSDWGWKGHGDAPDLIARLPKSVWLMSVSEWALPIECGGIKSQVGEYSISSVGPGPRSLRHWAAAREAGLKIAAEIQFNNTCELASIPYLPVLDLVAEHCQNLAPTRLDGMLIGWTMGGYPSPNFHLTRRMSLTQSPGAEAALEALARERFGPDGAPLARRAWTLTSDAFRQYPFHVSVVYTSPVQCGPANPLFASKTGYAATMWGFPYDDLDGWRGPYPPEVFAAQFEKMAAGWLGGVDMLRAAVERVPPGQKAEALADLRLARAAGLHFQSVANQARFVMAREALAGAADGASPDARDRWRREFARCLTSEIGLARELFRLTQEDSRIGFEPSCQYFYLPLDLVEKVINCRWVLGYHEQR